MCAATDPSVEKTYNLELTRWGISNNGTRPVETTKGINNALVWANQNGYDVFKVPAGTYLIDKDSRIYMVSDMTFWLDDRAVIQKQTNGYQRYETLYIDKMKRGITLKGGTYKGDRYTHDYSSGGTHESGYGILVEGGYNIIIDGVKAIEFTGDGLCLGTNDENFIKDVTQSDVESGAIDNNGNLTPSTSKIRLNKNLPLTNSVFKIVPFFQLSYPKGPAKTSLYDVYFYKADGTFLSSKKGITYSTQDVYIPAGAASFRAVFDTASTANFYVRYDVKVRTTNAVVKNSDFGFNRRQGITVGGVEKVLITGNKLHDSKGAKPESGIDLEGGLFLNNNVIIRGNEFYNNAAYDLILFDGKNATIEYNTFRSKAGGLTTSTDFYNAVVQRNTFDGAFALLLHDILFANNTIKNTFVRHYGPNITATGNLYENGTLDLEAKVPFSMNIYNETLKNTGTTHYSIVVKGAPQYLKDITVDGPNLLRAMTGPGSSESVYENLKLLNYNASELPAGSYLDCQFVSASGAAPQANAAGKYLFDRCSFTGKNASLLFNNTAGEYTVRNSKFTTTGNSETISMEAAKSVSILNNTFASQNLTSTDTAVINVKQYWATPAPFDVLQAEMTGNTIRTNIAAKGIQTTYAGTGAPGYTVQKNALYNAKLNLRPVDVSSNNVLK
ncbi:right-handed parallel beta-helix repeat-containing protein [Paenibacillus gansuensis]|uniref:Right-handed parallel beta-helix repeat-containing protein n=1 Tax=Paenibacillus gansuensis TaxID=306542 RepID=A0ABW5PGT3_9BACL